MRVAITKNTDQLNFEDFLGGVTRVVTIAGVKAGTKEQQYDVAIEGDQRVWRPAVTVLKLLVAAWGDDAPTWGLTLGMKELLDARAVLILARFEGLSYRQIAEVLGITEGAVESRLFRAMRRIEAVQARGNAQEKGASRVSRSEGKR